MKKFFVGIGFSKESFDATLLRADALGRPLHRQFRNSLPDYPRFLRWAIRLSGSPDLSSVLFCGEDTGLYSFPLSGLPVRPGPVHVA